ncbi:hypothetical protein P4T04_01925 [Bacillus badius]|uniref:hypothetical protein n=1 Tax=Bacillus badius TaxID=1455 RepID=UPI0007B072DC|nr:hypothetical protein [Bacillus badius]KZN99125.1 hypothetical protein A4244_08525 [Bacillus badius]MED0665076.1 hypothetical protein [Bacillus badius]OCS84063.1 hypothetical protein A6M11_08540 [Bacillus badius]OVE52643.1 hypothetical protein B1A98_03290 [Bacillus badius]
MLSIPGRFAFRGAGGEPPQRQSACGVSPVPLIPLESARLPFQSRKAIEAGQPYKTIEVRKKRSKHHPIQQDQIDQIALDQLVPENHLVRQIEAVIDKQEGE